MAYTQLIGEVYHTSFREMGTGGGIPEAPTDGKTYGRKDAGWVEIGGQPEPTEIKAIKFEAEGEQTVSMSSFDGLSLEHSFDGETFDDFTEAVTFGTTEHPFVYVRGTNPSGMNSKNFVFGNNTAYVTTSGNINYLLDYENEITELPINAFKGFFKNALALKDASNLILSATTLAEYCYNSMFYGCTSLVNAPELPATTLEVNCYGEMFRSCTSLVNAPELPATTLADSCYSSIFSGCSALSEVTIKATNISASYCLSGWLDYTAASGVIYCEPSMVSTFEADSDTPAGWVVKPILTLESLDAKVTDLELQVGNKADKVSVASSIPASGLLPNTLYNVGTLTGAVTIDLATPADNTIMNLYHICFETGATAPSITWGTAITSWMGGSAPTINASKHYEVSVLNGVGIAVEV